MDLPLLEELAREELKFKKFTFVGDDRVLVSGSLKTGFAVNIQPREEVVSAPTPPPEGCACVVRATFHDIVFDCPCSDDGHGQSFILTDNDLNGRSIDEPLRPDYIGCFDCVWQFGAWSTPYPLHADRWEFNNTCSGDPSSSADIIVALSVRFLAGVYYVYATVSTGVGDAVVFIGNSADPTNIPNDAFCSPTPTLWTDPCTSESRIGAAHGGYISLEFLPEGTVCGACCFFGGLCYSTTEAVCTELGGTYVGDETSCTPNPCE